MLGRGRKKEVETAPGFPPFFGTGERRNSGVLSKVTRSSPMGSAGVLILILCLGTLKAKCMHPGEVL